MRRQFQKSVIEPSKHIGYDFKQEQFLNKEIGGLSVDLSKVPSEIDQSVTADDYSLDNALATGLLLKPCPQMTMSRLQNADILTDNVALFNAAKTDIDTEKLNNN